MTQAPYLLPGARAGYRIGDQKVVDSMMYDGLFCAFDQVAMGAGTEKYAASAGLDREPQDDLAAKSHQRAAGAAKNGLFDDEIVPVEVPQRKGDPVVFDTDEGVRGDTTAESLAKLRPAFDKAGNITAGNASQISDGGAAVIVASKATAEQLGANPLGEIVGYGQVAGPDPSLLTQPSRAIKQALERAGKSVSDVSLFELNEAFAAVGLASMDDLGITDDIVNVNGGAIALGHPIGMSGTRVALTLLLELRAAAAASARRPCAAAAARATPLLVQTLKRRQPLAPLFCDDATAATRRWAHVQGHRGGHRWIGHSHQGGEERGGASGAVRLRAAPRERLQAGLGHARQRRRQRDRGLGGPLCSRPPRRVGAPGRPGHRAPSQGEDRDTPRVGDPAKAILRVAKKVEADLIVVGNKGMKGVKRFVLGRSPTTLPTTLLAL